MQDLVLLKEMVHAPKKKSRWRGAQGLSGWAFWRGPQRGASRDCIATLFAFLEAAEAACWLRDALDLLVGLHLLFVARPWRAICRRRVLHAVSGSAAAGYAIRPAKQHLRINGDRETVHVLYMLISLSRLPIEALKVKPPVKSS